MSKDKSIIDVVRWLEERLHQTLLIVDHWESDRFALGIARRQEPSQLVYIAALDDTDKYFVELEEAPETGSELPYRMVGQHHNVDRVELLKIIQTHLHIA